ncbi:MAG: DNA gyrase subunit A [Eubacteriales bacterium]|nr:DNA gyrase subunit A [Eubacteriales bacterium]MDD4328159.1 DNA gyrase subunit A [Eubacteriales bacterium]MDD4717949.1 DNA gyrase subunit A [Eubacteriales bacterium]
MAEKGYNGGVADGGAADINGKDTSAKAALAKERADAADQAFRTDYNTIIPVELEKEMKKSFIDYAMSVITDRALPDIRDGLKPVHRRILYSMFTQGFTPEKAFRKCATTVGDVLGRFHPHGDAAVYDSLVRLAQDFSMRHMLVDGHGNFGSRDGDPPAAYRYTEARLTKIAMEMMSDINKDTVDFKPNFDEHEMEPIVLPSRFPNLLVNGTTGIAVGMATSIPPHNLGEVIDGVVMLIDDPNVDEDDLMTVIPGPDFPTAGTIFGTNGVRSAYKTGKGRIVVRAKAEIEEFKGTRQRIVVHDLPYMVNKARLIEKVADLVKDKRIDGISDIRDESDRNEAVRIVIELKRDANANVVLNQLYKMTQLQDAFNANMLALVPDELGRFSPKLFTLMDALKYYLEHQKDVIRRRTNFDLEKALARKHIVEGLKIAIDNIDEVIRIIRSSMNEDQAKAGLTERFGFSEKQAQHIVDMRLGRLTGLEREKLENEYNDLVEKIEYFNNILKDESLLLSVIKDEILVLKNKYAQPRRTMIEIDEDDEITDESLIQEEEVVVTLTHFGYVKRLPVDTYKMQHRGGRGITGMQTREEDFVETILVTSTHAFILFFTNRGKVYKMKGYQIPEVGRTAKGMAIVNLLHLDGGEKIRTIIPVRNFEDEGYLIMGTAEGVVKKTKLSEYGNINKSGLIAINLRDEDELIGVRLTEGNDDITLVTRQGKSIRFNENDVRGTGRNTQGVRGISLEEDDSVIGMVPIDNDKTLLVISDHGFGKRTEMDEYRVQARGGKGILTYRTTEKTGLLSGIALVDDNNDIVLINDTGVIIRIAAKEIPVLSRATQGVTLMRSRDGKVVDIAVIDHDEEDEISAPEGEAGV